MRCSRAASAVALRPSARELIDGFLDGPTTAASSAPSRRSVSGGAKLPSSAWRDCTQRLAAATSSASTEK